jgi:prepilin-type N-terminal cleavage/methylation domain-containing protein
MNIKTNIYRPQKGRGGFTLIEILVVLGILAILATLVLVAVNPSRQFKMARDTKRAANVATILNAISQNISDHGGSFVCNGTISNLPTTAKVMSSDAAGFNLAECVVPDFISGLPYDPGVEGAHYTNEADYDTAYRVSQDTFGRVTIAADGELAETGEISATR